MLYHSIQIQNYRCYADFTVSLQPGVNVVAGVNGSGKTSLLLAILESMMGFLAFLQVPYGSQLQDGNVRIRVTSENGRYRFEPQFPVKITATATVLDADFTWSMFRGDQASVPQWQGAMPGQRWNDVTRLTSQDASRELPLLAFYPAYRQWPPHKPNEMMAATQRESRTDGYRSWWEASSEVSVFQQWAIGKSMERLQLASERATTWDSVQDDELALVNAALSKVVEGTKGLRYDFARKALVVEWIDDEAPPTLFDNLSDGQRVAVSLVADIARRMCLLNPHLGQQVTEQTPGVILIDELDIHLHPRWQRLMVAGLPKAFPKIQFIASSHSPQILGELRPEQIILLTDAGAVHPAASYGLDSSRVLEQIMDAAPRSTEVQMLLDNLFLTIEKAGVQQGRAALEQAKLDVPDLPELVRAEALLKRKEVLGR